MFRIQFLHLFLLFLSLGKPSFCEETPTYFEYSIQDRQQLHEQVSEYFFSKEELKKWDQIIAEAFKHAPASLTAVRLYTYLYVAQIETAKLSSQIHGNLVGSLDPISYTIITLFLPKQQKPSDYKEDRYSNTLAKIVSEKIRQRMDREDACHIEYKVPKKLEQNFIVGINTAAWIPWYAIPATAYWPPPPPNLDDPIWKDEIKEIRREQKNLTKEKKKKIYLWAGFDESEKSDWREIANDYLFTHDVPLYKMLQIRSVLLMGMYDAFIVGFGAKYHYLSIRPNMYDPTLQHEIPIPKHPSYPANHSLISSLAATILSYFFPSQSSHWNQLADESGLSRIWSGVHYPLDDLAGRETGKKIANNLLDQVFETSMNSNQVSHD